MIGGHYMYSLFSYLDEVKKIKETCETVIVDASECKYTIEFELSSKDNEFLQLPNLFFENKNIIIHVDNIIKTNTKDFISPFIEDELDELKISIIFNFVIENGTWNLFFYDENTLLEFLKNALNIKHSILLGIENKVSINLFKSLNIDFESSIFNINIIHPDSDTITSLIPLEEQTINFINNTINKDIAIGSIPGVFKSNIQDKVYPYSLTISSYLNLLANSNNDTHYHFFGKHLLEITLDNAISIENAKTISNDLMETIDFIYTDLKTSDQKLTFYRKVFTEYNKSNNHLLINDTISPDFFKDILNQTKYVYDAYEDGEISAYIKEKKEIVKEYLAISKEVIQASGNLKNNLLKNIITILILFTTNILLKINTVNSTKLIFAAILLFLIVLILLNIFHDIAQYTNFENRIVTLKNYFKFISKESKDLQTDTDQLLKNELSTMKFMTYSPLIIYIILAFISFLMLLS